MSGGRAVLRLAGGRRAGPPPAGVRLRGAWRLLVAAVLVPAALLPAAHPVAGQQVRLAVSPRTEAQRALAAFLERGGWALWTRDTVLARGDTVPSSVLVLEAQARIAGRVEGDVHVVDGDLFLRSGGRVTGDVVVIGGGFYGSGLAEVAGEVLYRPTEGMRVLPEDGGYAIRPVERDLRAWDLDGQLGFPLPTYQRVDAVILGWGGAVREPDLPGRPELEASVRFKTGPEKLEGSARLSVHPSGRLRVGAVAGRATRSNDEWIRPAWWNSLTTLFAGHDARDYHRANRAALELELVSAPSPEWHPAARWSATLAGGWEEARRLAARDVTVLLADDSARANPAVDPGDLWSVRAGFLWRYEDGEGRVAVGLGLEGASEDAAGDFSFLLGEARLALERPLRRGDARAHRVELFAIGRADLAGSLPRQRWSSLGGIGTLPTLDLLSLRGERLLYAEATYAVPFFGPGDLAAADAFLRGSAGSAWSEGEALRLEENLALGVRARVWTFSAETGVAAGPAAGPDDLDFQLFFDVRVGRSARPTSMPMPRRAY